MLTLLQRGARFLGDKLQSRAVAGRTVTYKRGQTANPGIVGWVDIHIYEVITDEEVSTRVESFDWTFRTTDLTIQAEAIEPRPRDQIIETLNGVEVVYEVMRVGDRPCFEWLDTSGIMTLVHTKRVG